jgi:hypothetical protein
VSPEARGATRFGGWLPTLALPLVAGCSGPELYIENDALGLGRADDRYYTSGLRFQNTITREDAPEWVRGLAGGLRPFKEEEPTEIGFVLGHHVYTPADLQTAELIVDDRPYGGWLYGGLVRIDSDFEPGGIGSDDQTTTELILGLIGPDAHAEQLQNAIHGVIGSRDPQGWDNQLENEVTLMLSFQRQSRTWKGSLGGLDMDLISLGSASLGTPYTGVEVGATARVGWNLVRDFGVSVNEPSLANSAVTRTDENPRSFYFFTGTSGRGVLVNTFLDGNTFRDSHEVDKEYLGADLTAGFAVQVGRFRLTYAWVLRTKEFEQQDGNAIFGSLSLGWTSRE